MFNKEDFLVFHKESAGQGYERSPFFGDEYYNKLPDSGYGSGRGAERFNKVPEKDNRNGDLGPVCPACAGLGVADEGGTCMNCDGEGVDPWAVQASLLNLDNNQTWTGYVRSNSEKQPDTFAEFVKDICRG